MRMLHCIATKLSAALLLCLCLVFGLQITWSDAVPLYEGQPYEGGDIFADTWVATDALGREVPGFAQCGPVKQDKWVGIFYWTWHTDNRGGPYDNAKLLAQAKNGIVPWPEKQAAHHWGEPELGYYVMTDPFVIRKHASMLTDAGVDVILFDTTNPPFTWKDEYEALCHEYTEMRNQGAQTPSISFITPFGDPRPVLERLWKDLYKPGKWRELWFQWEGKPIILANKDYIEDDEIKKFFTFRRPMPDYWKGPSGPDQWSWLEVYPQHIFKNRAGENEQMSVGVAQNALPNTPGPAPMSHKSGAMGRSWHNGAKDTRKKSVHRGLNFKEQWERALEVNPKFIFVTGWNEWIAGRYTEWYKYTDEDCYYPGGLFVDQYNHEYSRDCEPMRHGHTDSYYYQLASWIRRFKGVRKQPHSFRPSQITIDGSFDDWRDVQPEFRDTIGDTQHRHHHGYGSLMYHNETGRNDFIISKATHDQNFIYFFIQTLEKITSFQDSHWMLLFIDGDRNTQTGWLGYDYIVNLKVYNQNETSIQTWENDSWGEVGKIKYRVNGNGLELSIPRKLIGKEEKPLSFDFHWADNIQSFQGISEFGLNGDSAPNRRWNYRYEANKQVNQ